MGIDYIINMDCMVKKALTQDGMVAMIKDRRLAQQIMYNEGIRAGKSFEELRAMRFKYTFKVGDEERTDDLTIDDLLERAEPLGEQKARCSGCSLGSICLNDLAKTGRRLKAKPFACYNNINYPISAKAEEWLAGMARGALEEGGVRKIIIDYILEENLSDAGISHMRADPQGAFYELRQPLEIVVGQGFTDRKPITTDHLLAVTFGAGTMSTTHMWGLLMMSGAFRIGGMMPGHEGDKTVVKSTDWQGKECWLELDNMDDQADDRSTSQLKAFFRAMFFAYALNKEMLVSTHAEG
jgi:hypothetical protein